MSLKQQKEQEIKFEVEGSVGDPTFEDIEHVATASKPSIMELDARYFDTPDLTLSHAKITLRRRTGGKDAGWHLKTNTSDGRQETHAPLDSSEENQVPDALRQLVAEHVGEEPLVEIARIRNRRAETLLLTHDGTAIAEFCDDHVEAQNSNEHHARRWREWEVEATQQAQDLGIAAEILASALEVLGSMQGVEKATRASKLQRALGRA
ncbi:CYTH domain-containing protein [Corynebacterium gerontici]|uniref:CYTH domain protein n=1 Tax=Corynebacterium gerontici TaxID=2079234 RepID=A0A3G6J5W4_9CORY|nr:CYTH domain-containing protein [Corynebacterium gerontici]AZA11840.1 CYTH domain protein [Corynebacterium gerontici]